MKKKSRYVKRAVSVTGSQGPFDTSEVRICPAVSSSHTLLTSATHSSPRSHTPHDARLTLTLTLLIVSRGGREQVRVSLDSNMFSLKQPKTKNTDGKSVWFSGLTGVKHQRDQTGVLLKMRTILFSVRRSISLGSGTITALYAEKLNLRERRHQKPIKARTKPLMKLLRRNLGLNLPYAEQIQPGKGLERAGNEPGKGWERDGKGTGKGQERDRKGIGKGLERDGKGTGKGLERDGKGPENGRERARKGPGKGRERVGKGPGKGQKMAGKGPGKGRDLHKQF
ncbi:unnamed protein product [Leuciscus chuanchicus]